MNVPERTLRSWVGAGFSHAFHFVDENEADFDLTGASITWSVLSMGGGATSFSIAGDDALVSFTPASGLFSFSLPDSHTDLSALKASGSYAHKLDITLPGEIKRTYVAGPFIRYREGVAFGSSDDSQTEVTINANGETTKLIVGGAYLIADSQKGIAGGIASLDANSKVSQDPASKGTANGVTGNAADGMIEQGQSRLRYFNTAADAQAASDLKGGQLLDVMELGGGIHKFVATRPDTEDHGTVRNVTAGGQIKRVAIIQNPYELDISWWKPTEGDLSADRVAAQENYWALQRALQKASEQSNRYVRLYIPHELDVEVPADLDRTALKAEMHNTSNDVVVPAAWTKKNTWLEIYGGGKIRHLNWWGDYRYGNRLFQFTGGNFVNIRDMAFEGYDNYGGKVDPVLVNITAGSTTITARGGDTFDETYHPDRYVTVNYVSGGARKSIYSRITSVAVGGGSATIVDAIPAGATDPGNLKAGVRLDPRIAAEKTLLDSRAERWGPYGSALLYSWGLVGSDVTQAVNHAESELNLQNVKIKGNTNYYPVICHHGDTLLSLDNTQINGGVQCATMYSHNVAKPRYHSKNDSVTKNGAYVPDDAVNSLSDGGYTSGIYGHNNYLHVNISVDWDGHKTTGGLGTPYRQSATGSSVNVAPEYVRFNKVVAKDTGEEWFLNERMGAVHIGCEFDRVGFRERGTWSLKHHFIGCKGEYISFNLGGAFAFWEGGDLTLKEILSADTNGQLHVKGVEKLKLDRAAGAPVWNSTVAGFLVNFEDIGELTIVNLTTAIATMSAGKIRFKNVGFKGAGTAPWIEVNSGGAAEVLDSDQPDQTNNLLQEGASAPAVEAIKVKRSNVKTGAFTKAQLVDLPGKQTLDIYHTKSGITDAIATGVLRVKVPAKADTAVDEIGEHVTDLQAMVVHVAANGKTATKLVSLRMARASSDITGPAGTAPVAIVFGDSGVASANSAEVSIGTVTASATEVSELEVELQLNIDLTGTSVGTATIILDGNVRWRGYTQAPKITLL